MNTLVMIDPMGHEIKLPIQMWALTFRSEAWSKRQMLTGWRKSLA